MIYNSEELDSIFRSAIKKACPLWPAGAGWTIDVTPTGATLVCSYEDEQTNYKEVQIRIPLPTYDVIVTYGGKIVSKANYEHAHALAQVTGSRQVTVVDEKYGPPATYTVG